MTDINEAIQEMYQKSMQLQSLLYGDPGRAAARASATPQQMYADLAAQCPVQHHVDNLYTLSSREDILFANKHRNVEQGSRFLGSDRPAIPLGLDGEEHRKY